MTRYLKGMLLFLVPLMLACLSATMRAQTSFGQIAGNVTDASGAVVPAATVTVTNVGTQVVRTVTTDERGYYILTSLPIGDYSIQVTASGFRGENRTGISITADAHLTSDFQLQIGGATETVTVSAVSGETLNTTSGELAHVIDPKQVANLPLNGRNYIQLMTLIPGAITTNPDNFAITTSLASNTQSINGNRADSSNLTVDGAYNQVAGSNSSLMNNVSPDFIQEVKIATSNFSAEYGRTSGPAFNIVTKSGTNSFHGGAFYFMRNNYLDARNYFAATKTQLIYNDFGYSIGGPVFRDKLFFFGGEEWRRLRQQAAPTRFTVPDSAELAGNFGSTTLYMPGTFGTTKTPIPGNNISSLITPDGQAIANVYRTMVGLALSYSDTPTANNLTLAPSNPLNFRQDFVRLDYHLNDKHFLYGRWINDNNSLIDPYGTFSDSGVLPTTPTQRNRPGQSYLLAHTWNITPTIINQAQVNFSWAAQRIPPYGVNWERSTFGFQYNRLYPGGGSYPNGIPKVTITNFAPFQGPNFALKSPTTDIEVGDSISFIKGNHLIKAGVIVIRDRVDQNGRPYYTGNINFSGSNAALTTGNSIADALLGNFASYSEASSDPTGHFRFTQPEAFAQDSWRMLRNLSIEYGIRFQYIQSMYTQGNNMGNFDPAVYAAGTPVQVNTNGTLVPNSGNPFNGLVRAGSGVPANQAGRVPNINTALFPLIPAGAPRGLYNMNGAVGPRFGFAYAANEKTSIRGGYGVFFFRPEGNLTFSQVNVAPFLSNTEFDNGNLGTLGTGTPNTSALQGTITAINPHLVNPYIQQYSLGVQRQLPYDILLETSYVGNVGRHLVRQPNINFPSLPGVAANPSFSTNYFNPYKGYSTINGWLSDSTTNYNALQIYASKRAGRVTFTAGYTYAKNLGDSSSNNVTLENWQNLQYNYGSLSIDRKHAFVGTAVWQIAELRGQNMLVRETLGGWQLSGVGRAQSGPYYTIAGSTTTGNRRADFQGGPYLVQSGRNANNYINKSAFIAPNAGVFGNSGVAPVEGPGLQQIDATLAKTFAAERRVQARFQWDMFNVLNRTNYSNLNATLPTRGTSLTNNPFGTISAAYPPRQMQFGLRIIF
jgi:Carboxypeptidase regulatory-like domain